MVSFSFQPEFVTPIIDGQKIQTVRKTLRCKYGDRMHLYTGLRTKQCKLIAVKKCAMVGRVIIEPRGVSIGNAVRDDYEMLPFDSAHSDLFAMADGFLNYRAMYAWFLDSYKQEVFHGFVHRWRAI